MTGPRRSVGGRVEGRSQEEDETRYDAASSLRRLFPADPNTTGPTLDTPADLPPEWRLLWDERAAIMQFDGNLPRERAEALAPADIRAQMNSPTGERVRRQIQNVHCLCDSR